MEVVKNSKMNERAATYAAKPAAADTKNAPVAEDTADALAAEYT